MSGRKLTTAEINDSIATEWTDGFLTAPKPYPVTLTVRTPQHREVIEKEYADAQRIFAEYED